MKKFLSLVLALVMTMSLVTISAGAKDFADDSDIDYKAAVDVISELGVVDGYSDNSFRPDGLLTRGAAAKIICNLILGPTTASALSASTAPFKDVPTTNVFAGYITYCAQQGIISGYGDGTFRPTGTLTGNAFMKMLLGALGYDASIEGYTGANWQVNVVKQAIGIGLDDGNDNFVGSKSVTRGEAALYAFNMLQATMVEYDQQSMTAHDAAAKAVREVEQNMGQLSLLLKHTTTYRKLKPLYEQYRKSSDKEKYLRGHESEIILFETAAKALKQMGVSKLPDPVKLKQDYTALSEKKNKLYEEYREAKKQMQEYGIIKKNVDSILYPSQSRAKEQER